MVKTGSIDFIPRTKGEQYLLLDILFGLNADDYLTIYEPNMYSYQALKRMRKEFPDTYRRALRIYAEVNQNLYKGKHPDRQLKPL